MDAKNPLEDAARWLQNAQLAVKDKEVRTLGMVNADTPNYIRENVSFSTRLAPAPKN